jgi:hypothetical protein
MGSSQSDLTRLFRALHDRPGVFVMPIRLGAAAGLVGASIEGATGDPDRPIYDASLAAERIAAARALRHRAARRYLDGARCRHAA